MKSIWQKLSSINVNDHVEKKGQLSYLSWSWAWATLMENYPASTYEPLANVTYPDGSVEVWIALTVSDGDESYTRKMWLPVMDNRNNAVLNPTARQISDTRMRCLVKAIAMFGLGHYIYAGEDLPQAEKAAVSGATMAKLERLASERDDRAKWVREHAATLSEAKANQIINKWKTHDKEAA